LQHLSTYMFLFHNRVLQCLACYWGWSCQFVFAGSTVWLPYLLACFCWFWYMFIPVFLSSCTPLSLHMFNVAVHPLYHVFLYTVLLPVLGMLIWCGLLSHQIGGNYYYYYIVLAIFFFYLLIDLFILDIQGLPLSSQTTKSHTSKIPQLLRLHSLTHTILLLDCSLTGLLSSVICC
jgi:hypothetical protein